MFLRIGIGLTLYEVARAIEPVPTRLRLKLVITDV